MATKHSNVSKATWHTHGKGSAKENCRMAVPFRRGTSVAGGRRRGQLTHISLTCVLIEFPAERITSLTAVLLCGDGWWADRAPKAGVGREREREIGKEQSFSQDWWAICIPARWAVHPANETRVGGVAGCGGMDTNSITTYRRLHVRSGQVKLPAPTFPFLFPLPGASEKVVQK